MFNAQSITYSEVYAPMLKRLCTPYCQQLLEGRIHTSKIQECHKNEIHPSIGNRSQGKLECIRDPLSRVNINIR